VMSKGDSTNVDIDDIFDNIEELFAPDGEDNADTPPPPPPSSSLTKTKNAGNKNKKLKQKKKKKKKPRRKINTKESEREKRSKRKRKLRSIQRKDIYATVRNKSLLEFDELFKAQKEQKRATQQRKSELAATKTKFAQWTRETKTAEERVEDMLMQLGSYANTVDSDDIESAKELCKECISLCSEVKSLTSAALAVVENTLQENNQCFRSIDAFREQMRRMQQTFMEDTVPIFSGVPIVDEAPGASQSLPALSSSSSAMAKRTGGSGSSNRREPIYVRNTSFSRRGRGSGGGGANSKRGAAKGKKATSTMTTIATRAAGRGGGGGFGNSRSYVCRSCPYCSALDSGLENCTLVTSMGPRQPYVEPDSSRGIPLGGIVTSPLDVHYNKKQTK